MPIGRLLTACYFTAALTLCTGALTQGADYYISTQTDFDLHRQATLSPGDNVYFQRGQVFNGMFAPNAVGTANNIVNISTYGTGPRPIIHNNGVLHAHPTRSDETISAGVFLFNTEYVNLEGLEITNNNGGDQDDQDLFGIYVLGEDTNKYHNHIHIKDNYVHHVNGAVAGKRRGGIHVHGYSPGTPSQTATYNDVRIVNNVIDQIGGVGIGTDVDNIVDANDFTGTNRENAITNLYVAHNWIGNTGRNSVIARDADYAVYEYNTSANSSLHSTGHSFFNFKTLGMVWQYNEAYGNVGSQAEHDRGGFDADFDSRDTTIQYNYSHDNDWFVGIMKKPNADVIIRHNLSVNDGGAFHYGFEDESDLTNVHAYNNTFYFPADTSPELIPLGRTPHETTFNNNLFHAEGSATPGPNADNGVNVTYDTNGYFNVTPPNSETNALTQNPQLLSPGAIPRDIDLEFGRDVLNGYRLAADSPYHNSGIPIADNGGTDFWGQPLTSNTVGASQFDPSLQLTPGATLLTNTAMPNVNSLHAVVATTNESALGDDAEVSLSQTFQIDSTFDLNTIFLGYEYDPSADPNDSLINVEIFEVADVGADELLQGTSLLTITGLTAQNDPNSHESAIVLDSPLTLEATTGTNGYALRITGSGNPGFEWLRTGSSSASVYAFGQAYEDGSATQSGDRDFVLALSSDNPFWLTGDYNFDGHVDAADYTVWRDTLGQTGPGLAADANNDGIIDNLDHAAWVDNFGTSTNATDAITVPEPGSSAMLLGIFFGACLLLRRSRT